MSPEEYADYCLKTARTQDYGAYLAAIKAPADLRLPLIALLAFEAELQQIPLKTREEMAAHVRFAWWREGLDAIAKGEIAREHPVLQTIADLREKLPFSALHAMVDAYQEFYPKEPVSDLYRAAALALLEKSPSQPRWEKAYGRARRHRQRFGDQKPLRLVLTLMFS